MLYSSILRSQSASSNPFERQTTCDHVIAFPPRHRPSISNSHTDEEIRVGSPALTGSPFGVHDYVCASGTWSAPTVPLLHRVAFAFKFTKTRRTQKGPESVHYDVPDNEEVRAKLWSIYISEAERYDYALVESWKADMEGMLIFPGLFSASLTPFLIESYKTLQPDSGDLTVQAIQLVSQQLAAIANGTSFSIPASAPFRATRESLGRNALWFISLSLSLTCALLATLVEQWAHEFLHKTEIHPSPVRRARICSFLYFGLKRFRMHTIVHVIPFLLHASLFFFAGLVAFLFPVNPIVMYLICIALGIFFLLYSIPTILPVVYLDCPYRTPLSTPLWAIVEQMASFFAADDPKTADNTLTESVVDQAIQNTKDRDQRAIQWTLDSCTDDTELLPFIETIPEVLHGETGFRSGNASLFHRVLGDTETASPLVL